MKLHGVFIGIDLYADDRIAPLQFAKADAEALYQLFKSSLPPPDIDLSMLTNERATRQAIMETIGERIPRVASADDLVLLFFAGHGAPESAGHIDDVSRYFITHDTKFESIFSSAIDMERDLKRILERIPAMLTVVLMDTCFSGQAGGRTFQGPALAQYKKDWREGVLWTDLDLGEGRIILTASDSDEAARESRELQHGVFTYFVLRSLTESPGTSISLNNLYEVVSQNVKLFTNGRQNPVMNGRVKSARLPVLRDN